MCYNAFTEKARTQQIAREDTRVYKICMTTNHMVVSYHRNYVYVPLEITNEIGITFAKKNGLEVVEDGYHSYKSCKWGTRCISIWNIPAIVEDRIVTYYNLSNIVIAEFIIPKNTVYYQNNNGEIVSEQIMFTGIIHKPIIHDDGSIESVKIDLNEENRTVSTKTVR